MNCIISYLRVEMQIIRKIIINHIFNQYWSQKSIPKVIRFEIFILCLFIKMITAIPYSESKYLLDKK